MIDRYDDPAREPDLPHERREREQEVIDRIAERAGMTPERVVQILSRERLAQIVEMHR